MEDLQNKKIIRELIKHKQINTAYRGQNINSPSIKNILENFFNNEYTIGPKDVPRI